MKKCKIWTKINAVSIEIFCLQQPRLSHVMWIIEWIWCIFILYSSNRGQYQIFSERHKEIFLSSIPVENEITKMLTHYSLVTELLTIRFHGTKQKGSIELVESGNFKKEGISLRWIFTTRPHDWSKRFNSWFEFCLYILVFVLSLRTDFYINFKFAVQFWGFDNNAFQI